MDLSLVICTRNRSAQLAQTLKAVKSLDSKLAWELVAVDNGSSDGTMETLRSYRDSCGHAMVIVREERPGLGRARNAGWKAATGRLIAFTDDDCYPAANYLDEVWACFHETDIHFLGGRLLLFDPNDAPVSIQTRETRLEVEPGSFIPAGLIQGANFAFSRDVLTSLGGFDPELGAGTPFPCEDVDMTSRASAAGLRGAYDPRPVIFHHHMRKVGADVEQLERAYDIGRGAYFAKALLDPRRRATYARHWYWEMRAAVSRGQFRRVARELKGATSYIVHRAGSG